MRTDAAFYMYRHGSTTELNLLHIHYRCIQYFMYFKLIVKLVLRDILFEHIYSIL